MTISITIKNNDSREKAIVSCKLLQQEPKSLLPTVFHQGELKGGESKELYVFDGQSVLVEEVENG